jgi:hypothetical protein
MPWRFCLVVTWSARKLAKSILLFVNIKMVALHGLLVVSWAGQRQKSVKIAGMTLPDAPALPPAQPRNPFHGVTLQAILTALVEHYGWPGLAERIAIGCFAHEPSIASSLKFLRKTPWARDKVEGLYLFMLREIRRNGN